MNGISVVVPIYNESENIEALHTEINRVCELLNRPYEIIFVDDGSTDNSKEILQRLSPLTSIFLRKNFGQTAAMDAGIKQAQFEYIITMDGDLQNVPSEIPNLIAYLEEHDLDVVSGWRKERKDSFAKKTISKGAYFLRSLIVADGIHDSGCSLKIYKKECFEGLHLYGEMHRFIPALLKIRGFKIGELAVAHRARLYGVTKYNWKRVFKGFSDMISICLWAKFASRPQHLFGGLGIAFLFFGALSGITTIFEYIERGKVGDTAWPVLTIFLCISGIIFFSFGFMMEMLSKLYRESTSNKSYFIKDVYINNEVTNTK